MIIPGQKPGVFWQGFIKKETTFVPVVSLTIFNVVVFLLFMLLP
jgi:hypothetical protein